MSTRPVQTHQLATGTAAPAAIAGLVDHEPSPLRLDVDYQERYRRWLPLVRLLLLVPQSIALLFVEIGAAFGWLLAALAVIATGRYPRGLFEYMTGVGRWQLRYAGYLYMLTDAYPPFALYDQPAYPVRVALEYPPGGRIARWRPLVAWLLVVPQALELLVLYTGMFLLQLVALVSIVLTGTLPRPAFDMTVRILRFHGRVIAYAFFLTERYPGFVV
jgi:hypothetical protein